jgi:hypothetical protein
MSPRIFVALIAACALSGRPAGSQTMVSFDVPMKLTQVSADIERVAVLCALVPSEALVIPSTSTTMNLNNYLSSTTTGGAGWSRQEFLILAGQLIVTARLVIQIPAEWLQNPIGKTAQYGCLFGGYNKSTQRWDQFAADASVVAFRLTPTPQPITGTFVW